MASPRTTARIAARIQERAAHCLQFEIRDPRASFVTITRVEVSSDLSLAKVYYSVLGDESDKRKVEHMLEHARGFVQRQVGRVLHMRRIPHLRFVYDDSIETAAHIDQLIRAARTRDLEIDPSLAEREAAEARPAADGAGGASAGGTLDEAAVGDLDGDLDDEDDDWEYDAFEGDEESGPAGGTR